MPHLNETKSHPNKMDMLHETFVNTYNCTPKDSSSDEEVNFIVPNKRKKVISNSSSDDDDGTRVQNCQDLNQESNSNDSDVPSNVNNVQKSRILHLESGSSSDEESQKKKVSISRRDRKKKLRERFEKLKSKDQLIRSEENINSKSDDTDEEEEISCLQIKQSMTEKAQCNLSICDPDNSDDDVRTTEIKKIIGSKSVDAKQKPIRMSAKEAMENMQKIKSESNRMLREKEVSLPYHRPKAISLKDILNRRRPAVSSDGKTLPIKMNEDQLRHYAMMLEERQKEVIELCKSDTEEENNQSDTETQNQADEKIGLDKVHEESDKLSNNNERSDNGPDKDEYMSHVNDESFDEIASKINESQTENYNNDLEINENIVDPNLESGNKICDNISIDSNSFNINCQITDSKMSDNVQLVSDTNHGDNESISVESIKNTNKIDENTESDVDNYKHDESQVTSKQFESKNIDSEEQYNGLRNADAEIPTSKDGSRNENGNTFSDIELDDEIDIDKFIENTVVEGKADLPIVSINKQPKLTGAPGMVISLDDEKDPVKPSGVQLLKERFKYFTKLQNLDDMEKDREKKFKPGTQHIKLKQQLEEEIAEQRSLEWEKRLEEEKLLKSEQREILGEDESLEDIDKIEAKLEGLEEKNIENDNSTDSDDDDEEDLIENDVDMTDKPSKHNPMIEDEAEESEDDETSVPVKDFNDADIETNEEDDRMDTENESNNDNIADDEDQESESSDSSDSEDELNKAKPKKGRILKAFEDSDDENGLLENNENINIINKNDKEILKLKETVNDNISQDDDLQLAQANKSLSEDLFPSQESDSSVAPLSKLGEGLSSGDLGTFSILNTKPMEILEKDCNSVVPDNVPVFCTQTDDADVGIIAPVYSGIVPQEVALTQISQTPASLDIGDDVAALCTGKFVDNQFLSQMDSPKCDLEETPNLDTETLQTPPVLSLENNELENVIDTEKTHNNEAIATEVKKCDEKAVLNDILNELDEPDFDKPKQYKFFTPNESVKKKLVIDSDDEDAAKVQDPKTKKKKKRKLEKRALQISDDESEEEEIQSDNEDYESDEDVVEKVYEYDSEENEVEVQDVPKKKKRIGDFFENEAELTSEDEWAGSGDEDEAGLDRMEREEGDDEVFQQDKLQRELGQIHMREVLDQDKREVRLIQELLFEDADLGDGHRQRKFRWKNIDGEDETGTIADEFDTQEEEFESEELWRKQRHEREMFLRKMQENSEEELNISINRTSLIKANLTSKTDNSTEMKETSLGKENASENSENKAEKTVKDIPSPKKPFAIFKQSYHGSLLSRGHGTLARLAALATPLVVDDDAPKVLASARGNFVFAARNDEEPKVKKRKAEPSVSTPQLIKKMKTEEYKKTLFDRLRD